MKHEQRCKDVTSEGYTVHHTAESPHPVDWDAALQWLVGILPASFAGKLLIFRSRGRDKQTLCSLVKGRKKKEKSLVNVSNVCFTWFVVKLLSFIWTVNCLTVAVH